MVDWKDDCINKNIIPVLELIAGAIDPEFSRIELVGWYEPGVVSNSYRVHDKVGEKIRLSPDRDLDENQEQILSSHLRAFRQCFIDHNEVWVCFQVVTDSEGAFEIRFDYENPMKFAF